MSSHPILVPDAKADVTDAYLWYEEKSLGLGMDFLRCIEAALLSIQREPLIYPVVHETYRRALVRRFPFAIFFRYRRFARPLRCLLGFPLLARFRQMARAFKVKGADPEKVKSGRPLT